ncbi:hypothetical protein [Pedobacter frigoris]|uniref:Uncharacterized protein n=1 Tax=Pedobacter frigoris TaxID=2571272 RepID=A0A4U1CN94_9SPHI|nr:hypothetical protein [Pedobacter frigoris]TKC09397.1 hypothetical protein FA047_04700 [Pedobacter frigoris]
MDLKKAGLFAILIMALEGCIQTGYEDVSKNPIIRYVADNNGDTAIATIEMLSPATFKGVLEIRYRGAYKDSGDIRGVVRGDTMIGDYNFQHYGLPKWNRNPLALLKRGDRLIMGEGMVMYTVGIPHYNPNTPIDYDESKRFVFFKDTISAK